MEGLQEPGSSFALASLLIVDDSAEWRARVREILEEHAGLQIVAEASDGLQAVHRVAELDPDLVVLDIGMPVLNGLDAAVQILRSSPRSKVVFLTQEDDTEIQDAAQAAGAHGYVLKVDAPRGLVDAIETALRQP